MRVAWIQLLAEEGYINQSYKVKCTALLHNRSLTFNANNKACLCAYHNGRKMIKLYAFYI